MGPSYKIRRLIFLANLRADKEKVPICLITTAQNAGACGFYRKFGYEEKLQKMEPKNKYLSDCIDWGLQDIQFTRKTQNFKN